MAGNYDNRELAVRANLPVLAVRGIFCGCFTGRWKSSLPLNRLIYIFESGPEPGRIGDAAEDCELLPGKWLYLPPFHEVMHDQREGLNLVSIHFNLELYSRLEVMGECGRIFQGNAPELRSSFAALTKPGGAFGEVARLHALVWRFLTEVIDRGAPSPEKLGRRFAGFSPLLEAFGKAPHADFSVEEMAGIMKMGRESFVKRFSAETGGSPRNFFNRQRAAAAARELANPETTVREVAMRFGFSSEFYFSRFFRRHFGMSPSDYRKSLKA